jgi:hypothetical protein
MMAWSPQMESLLLPDVGLAAQAETDNVELGLSEKRTGMSSEVKVALVGTEAEVNVIWSSRAAVAARIMECCISIHFFSVREKWIAM